MKAQSLTIAAAAVLLSASTAYAEEGAGAGANSNQTQASNKGSEVQPIIGWSLVGAGALSVIVGTYFLLDAASTWNSAKAACAGMQPACASYGQASAQDTSIAKVGWIAGGLMGVAGTIVLLIPIGSPDASHSGSGQNSALQLRPWLDPHSAGMSLGGAI